MDVRVVGRDLRRIDRLDVDVLVVPVHRDERPMRSVPGLLDWRLHGLLSRQLRAGRIDGAEGTSTLVSAGDRLPFDRLVLVGLGDSRDLDLERVRAYFDRAMRIFDRLRARRAALALPDGRSRPVDGDLLMEALAEHALAEHEFDSLVVLDDPDDPKALARAPDSVRRRARVHEPRASGPPDAHG